MEQEKEQQRLGTQELQHAGGTSPCSHSGYPDVTMADEEDEDEKTDISDYEESNGNITFPAAVSEFPDVKIKVEKEEEPWIMIHQSFDETSASSNANSVGFSIPKPESSPETEEEGESSTSWRKIKNENEDLEQNTVGFSIPKPESSPETEEEEESSTSSQRIKNENKDIEQNTGYPDIVVKMEEMEQEFPPTQGSEDMEAVCLGGFKLNSVELLQKTEFSRLSLADQLRIRMMGPHRPPLMLHQSRCERGKELTRKFSAGWYDRKEWLCGSATQDALFCFPCLLFGGVDTWTRTGVRDLKHLSDKIKRHETSQSHINSCLQLAILDAKSAKQKDGSGQESVRKQNEEIEKNRNSLLKVMEAILHCDIFGLLLSEEDEVEDSVHPGVFRGEVNLMAYLSLALKPDLQSSPVLAGLSKTILSDLLDCALAVAKDHIKEQLKSAPFVAIEVSHVDVSTHSQTALIFRYVDESRSLVERFYGFADLEDHQAETTAKFVLQQLEEVFPEAADKQKIIAQSYDGASATHGDRARIQDKICDAFPSAQYVHSYAHRMNTVIQQATSQIEEVRRFFADLSGIPEFFSCSAKRRQLLEAIVRRQLNKTSQINWNLNIQTVNYVFGKRLELLKCFCEIRRTWKFDTPAVRMAGLFIPMLEDDGEFLYLLSLFHRIMPHVDTFHRQLWSTVNNSVAIQKATSDFTSAISSVKESVGTLFGELPSESVLPTDKTKETLDQMALDVCNIITAHAKERFAFTSHLASATLVQGSLFRSHHRAFPQEAFDEAVKAYPMLEKERLMAELSVLYERQEFYRCKNAYQLLYVLSMYNLEKTFEQTVTLLRILVTTPAMVAEAGQAVSALTRVKTFLTNTMPHNKLNALAMLSVEKGMIKNIPGFSLKVVERFARQPEHHAGFLYKL
nr:uncharacterized protein LOC110070550 isoform X2 [Pogona vitticeps]